jgi:hypothetical protein
MAEAGKRPLQHFPVAGDVEPVAAGRVGVGGTPVEFELGFADELAGEGAQRAAVAFPERVQVVQVAVELGHAL